jgi:hypothetical protein
MASVRRTPDEASESSAARFAKHAALVVGLISGLVGLVFVLFPQIAPQRSEPPPEKSARISGLVSNPRTTRGQFLDYSEQSKLGFTKQQLAVLGASVFANVRIVGYEGTPLVLERQVIDARSGEVVGEARDFRVTPDSQRRGHQWWDWEPLRAGRGSYVVVIKLLEEHPTSVLACQQTRPFGGLGGIVEATAPQLCPRT